MAGLVVALLLIAATHQAPVAGGQAAGTVRGIVQDARTGTALARALVAIEDGPSALTTPDGRYELAGVAAGPRRLSVSVVGYVFARRDIAVPAGGVVEIDVPLAEGTGTYSETVTVAADRFQTPEPGVATQQVLGSADIQNLRGVLADDPLRAVQVSRASSPATTCAASSACGAAASAA